MKTKIVWRKVGGLSHQSPLSSPRPKQHNLLRGLLGNTSLFFGVGGWAESLSSHQLQQAPCSRAGQDNEHTNQVTVHHVRVMFFSASSGAHTHQHVASDLLVTPFILNSKRSVRHCRDAEANDMINGGSGHRSVVTHFRFPSVKKE